MVGPRLTTKPSFGGVEEVSAHLDGFLGTLCPPSGNDRTHSQLPYTLQGKREKLANLDHQWRVQSLRIAALRMSLSTAERIRKGIQAERNKTLGEANELALKNDRKVHFSNEILHHICAFAYPEPLDLFRAREFNNNPWGRIVFEHAVFKLRYGQFEGHSLDDIAELLPISAPAKLSVEAKGFYRRNDDFLRIALQFHPRWCELGLHSDDSEAACRMFRAESRRAMGRTVSVKSGEPFQSSGAPSSVLSQVRSLSINNNHITCLSGLLTAVTYLSLSVQTNATFRNDLALALKEMPSLTSLSIKWHSSGLPAHAFSMSSMTPCVNSSPNLKTLVLKFFIYPRQDDIKYLVDTLDGTTICELHVHCLGVSYDVNWADCRIVDFLGTKFPRVTHFGVRKQYMPSSHELAFRMQRAILGKLGNEDGTRASPLFPQLIHLSVEFDASKDGLNSLKTLLRARSVDTNVATVSSVKLYGIAREQKASDPLDYFNELQLYVTNLYIEA